MNLKLYGSRIPHFPDIVFIYTQIFILNFSYLHYPTVNGIKHIKFKHIKYPSYNIDMFSIN